MSNASEELMKRLPRTNGIAASCSSGSKSMDTRRWFKTEYGVHGGPHMNMS